MAPITTFNKIFLNILTLLASTQSADNVFHSSIVLCEKETSNI